MASSFYNVLLVASGVIKDNQRQREKGHCTLRSYNSNVFYAFTRTPDISIGRFDAPARRRLFLLTFF